MKVKTQTTTNTIYKRRDDESQSIAKSKNLVASSSSLLESQEDTMVIKNSNVNSKSHMARVHDQDHDDEDNKEYKEETLLQPEEQSPFSMTSHSVICQPEQNDIPLQSQTVTIRTLKTRKDDKEVLAKSKPEPGLYGHFRDKHPRRAGLQLHEHGGYGAGAVGPDSLGRTVVQKTIAQKPNRQRQGNININTNSNTRSVRFRQNVLGFEDSMNLGATQVLRNDNEKTVQKSGSAEDLFARALFGSWIHDIEQREKEYQKQLEQEYQKYLYKKW